MAGTWFLSHTAYERVTLALASVVLLALPHPAAVATRAIPTTRTPNRPSFDIYLSFRGRVGYPAQTPALPRGEVPVRVRTNDGLHGKFVKRARGRAGAGIAERSSASDGRRPLACDAVAWARTAPRPQPRRLARPHGRGRAGPRPARRTRRRARKRAPRGCGCTACPVPAAAGRAGRRRIGRNRRRARPSAGQGRGPAPRYPRRGRARSGGPPRARNGRRGGRRRRRTLPTRPAGR